jgi:hypothetical protein
MLAIQRTGIHRCGGYLLIGPETAPADIAHSHLIRDHATCLAEVCRHETVLLGDHLAEGLTTNGLAALALAALQADLLAGGEWAPLTELLSTAPERMRTATTIRLLVYQQACGSAFVLAPAVRGVTTSLRAVAASIWLDPQTRLVTATGLALLPRYGPILYASLVETLLRGQPVTVAAIAEAAQAAQAQVQEVLGPGTSSSSAFPIQVTAHLVRKALDRAAARALARLAN